MNSTTQTDKMTQKNLSKTISDILMGNDVDETILLMNGLISIPKHGKDGIKRVPVLHETNANGSIQTYLPVRCPPDTAAYNLNCAKQMERKTKMIAKLRQKKRARDEGMD